ncbi:MAG: RNA methyltransferase [Nitrosomonadales bacterium]|nr:RNA methyltransferase [Nitrosomonadales bacterium]
MRLSQLRQRLHDLGCKPCHADRLLRGWSRVCSYDKKGSPAATFFPAALRKELPAIEVELDGLARLHGEYPATLSPTLSRPPSPQSSPASGRGDQRERQSSIPAGEGTNAALRAISNTAEVARLLVQLHDGQMVESVLLPRGGLCVSTQVGCAVGCVFCMSGRDGLIRQLGSAEIVAQVVLARRRRAVSKVVFMGMGEPAHNLDNVLEAIELLGTLGNIGHKELVLSTVGDVRVFERLMASVSNSVHPAETTNSVRPELVEGTNGTDGGAVHASTAPARSTPVGAPSAGSARTECGSVKPALALSLHSTDDALRAKLLPHAPRIAVEELVARCQEYARATHYPTQYQWTLIEGVNDSDAELERIVALLAGKYAVMNFIPFNAVEGLPYRRPSTERIAAIMHTLNRRGIYTRIRDSAGQEVEGACGQLRARAEKAR